MITTWSFSIAIFQKFFHRLQEWTVLDPTSFKRLSGVSTLYQHIFHGTHGI
jgi:hypothetical protein